jgi:thioredoxin-related protein
MQVDEKARINAGALSQLTASNLQSARQDSAKNTMQIHLIALSAGLLLAAAPALRAGLEWTTDYKAALTRAEAEGKGVFLNFTGSDWCGWCFKLKAEVFDKPEFEAFAKANLVLVEVDFPRRKAQSDELKKQNQSLQALHRIQGYPTLVLLNGKGQQIGNYGYMPGGPGALIGQIKQAPGITWKSAEAPAAAPKSDKADKAADPFAGMPTGVKRYEELKLTGISGTEARRFAIVNNQTFSAGETASVKLKDGTVKLLCKEIRARSVVVQIEGAPEPRELFLGR